jgi:hypothetical protein
MVVDIGGGVVGIELHATGNFCVEDAIWKLGPSGSRMLTSNLLLHFATSLHRCAHVRRHDMTFSLACYSYDTARRCRNMCEP